MDTMTNTTSNTPNFYPAGLKMLGKVYQERIKARKRKDYSALEWDLNLGRWANKIFFNEKFPNRKERLIEYATIKYPNEYNGVLGTVVSVMEVLYETHKKWYKEDSHKHKYDFVRYAPMSHTFDDGTVSICPLQMKADTTVYDKQTGKYIDRDMWRGTPAFESILSTPNSYIVDMLIAIMRDELTVVLPSLGLEDAKPQKY